MSDGGGAALITALVTGGVGAAIGSVGTAIIQMFSKRGESRAAAADQVSHAAGNLADRLDRMNTNLERENKRVRAAIVALSDVMESIIPLLPDDVRGKAHEAITEFEAGLAVNHIDRETLVELVEVVEELRVIAKPRMLYEKVQFWAGLAALMTFNLGAVLFFGGPQRISARAYTVIADTGGPILWGLMFMGVATVTGLCVWQFHRALRWILLVQAIPYGAIAAGFAVAAVKYPDANLTAAPIYAWIMVLHACLADYARKEY